MSMEEEDELGTVDGLHLIQSHPGQETVLDELVGEQHGRLEHSPSTLQVLLYVLSLLLLRPQLTLQLLYYRLLQVYLLLLLRFLLLLGGRSLLAVVARE